VLTKRFGVAVMRGLTFVVFLLGCGDDTGPPNEGGGGPGGGASGGGASGGGGTCESELPSKTCDECNDAEHCVTCQHETLGRDGSIGYTTSISCEAIVQPTCNEFSCKWQPCNVGEVCLDIQPLGEACEDAECVQAPTECGSDPSCDCLTESFRGTVIGCKEDGAGNLTVTKYPG
jgi:hypothetical protein